jgi:hypothetical protein
MAGSSVRAIIGRNLLMPGTADFGLDIGTVGTGYEAGLDGSLPAR